MRTTVTLDEDVAAALHALARERGLSFKDVINTALRTGLGGVRPESTAYRLPSRDLGLRPGVDLDKAMHLDGSIDDDEIARKLALRK